MSVTSPDNSAGAAKTADNHVPALQHRRNWDRVFSDILLGILLPGILIRIGIFTGYAISSVPDAWLMILQESNT